MKINTMQDYDMVTCGDCCDDLPTCSGPRAKSQSRNINLCGYNSTVVDAHTDVNERFVLYASFSWNGSMDNNDQVGTNYDISTSYSYENTLEPTATTTFCRGKVTGGGSESINGYHDEERTKKSIVENRSWNVNGVDNGFGITVEVHDSYTTYDEDGEETGSGSDTFIKVIGAPFTPSVFGDGNWSGPTFTCDGGDDNITDSSSNYHGPQTVTFNSPYNVSSAIEALNNVEATFGGFTSSGLGIATITVNMAPDNVRITGASSNRIRYKIGVPSNFSTEDVPRSYYEAQWDEVYFPKVYDDWVPLRNAYDFAVAQHEAWVECMAHAENPESCGDEPTVPDEPDDPSEFPEIMGSHSWTWGGSMGDDEQEFSDWFVMEKPTGVGEVRVVNMMVKCWRSAKLGNKPTSVGEVFEEL